MHRRPISAPSVIGRIGAVVDGVRTGGAESDQLGITGIARYQRRQGVMQSSAATSNHRDGGAGIHEQFGDSRSNRARTDDDVVLHDESLMFSHCPPLRAVLTV